MNLTYTVKVLSPKGEIFFKEGVEFLKLPGQSGEIGVLPSHSHMVAKLVSGNMVLRYDEAEESFFISNGFVRITPNNVTLFSDYMESLNDIDRDRALRSKKRALDRLNSKDQFIDQERVRSALLRAEVRLLITKN